MYRGILYFSTEFIPGKMKRSPHIFIFIILLVWLTAGVLEAQREEPAGFMDKLFLGGNFGLQIGTVTNIEISPLVGYHITTRLAGGVGARYEYYKDSRNYFPFIPFKTNIYGGSVFSRYMVIQDLNRLIGLGPSSGIFAHTEYEILSLERKYFEVPATLQEGRFYLHSVLAGGGLYQPVGRRSAFTLAVLWNLNQTASSPYTNPIIRVGFHF
jgi:hypothetical protein